MSNTFNQQQFRAQFQALDSSTIYLDSASTALKPNMMIEATSNYYQHNTANALRGLHHNALLVSANIDFARQQMAKFINASSPHEIIWTRGATESINLIAQSYARAQLKSDDEIIVSELEHHSNLIPWLIVAQQTGAKVIKWSIESDYKLSIESLKNLLSKKTRIIAITQMSNVTGYQPDIANISQIAHQHNAIIVVDGAQGIVHQPLDVKMNDVDFYAFSAHKLYGPTGLGVLYAKSHLLDSMPVWHGGGKMLKSASFTDFEVDEIPNKFEAGTSNIAGIIGFNATLTWLNSFNLQKAEDYTLALADYAKIKLSQLPGIHFYQTEKSAILSFNIADIHHQDIAILLGQASTHQIALRTGELCAQPLMQALNCSGVIRLSLMPYNNQQDIDFAVDALTQAVEILL